MTGKLAWPERTFQDGDWVKLADPESFGEPADTVYFVWSGMFMTAGEWRYDLIGCDSDACSYSGDELKPASRPEWAGGLGQKMESER